MKSYIYLCVFLLSSVLACNPIENTEPVDDGSKIPTDVVDTTAIIDSMRIQMWIDAQANLSRFEKKESILRYLEKMHEIGFTEIYLDVKPGIGYALYESDILPKLTSWNEVSIERDWDYLGYWIEEAEKYNISIN